MPTDEHENQKPVLRPIASWATLAAIGVLAVIMGMSFVLLRPLIVLLPEDQRFTGMTPDQLRHSMANCLPGLAWCSARGELLRLA